MNVYKEHSDTTQGIGQDRSGEIIRYGKGINGVERKMDITELCTAIRPYGTDNITISGLSKKEYDKDIEIHLGLETEYFPRFWDQLIDFLSDYPFEYFVLGQHSLGNEIEKILYSGHGTTDGSYLKQYVDQCLAGIDTGKYLYLAHPDLFLFNGDEAVFDREYRRLCREVKKRNIPLEINFLGLMEERWYPNEKFWKIAGEEGNTAVFGCDAHTPKAVWNPETEQKALQLAAKYGLKVQETVPMPKTF